MKEPWEWEEEDIEELITNGVQESLTLDYKKSAALDRRNPKAKSDLSEDVSAFANSAGGVLIYGVREDNHLPVEIDNGYDPRDITREWIEQVINSTIQQRIDGIRIKQIVLKKKNPGNVIYVVSVPPSKRAPHMAVDHVFYKRFNYQSVAMEEYEVRDVARRFEGPDLYTRLIVGNENQEIDYPTREGPSAPIVVNVIAGNSSRTPAMYYNMKFYIDGRLELVRHDGFERLSERKHFNASGQRVPFITLAKSHAIPVHLPLWRGQDYMYGGFEVALPSLNLSENFRISWDISAPEMELRRGDYVLNARVDARNPFFQLMPLEEFGDLGMMGVGWRDPD